MGTTPQPGCTVQNVGWGSAPSPRDKGPRPNASRLLGAPNASLRLGRRPVRRVNRTSGSRAVRRPAAGAARTATVGVASGPAFCVTGLRRPKTRCLPTVAGSADGPSDRTVFAPGLVICQPGSFFSNGPRWNRRSTDDIFARKRFTLPHCLRAIEGRSTSGDRD